MHIRNSLEVIVLLVLSLALANGVSNCNVCMSNGIACVNETSFSICYGPSTSIVDTSQVISCPYGKVCTALKLVCAPRGTDITDALPACGDTSKCGDCSGSGFTCTSRSTFALCSGGNLSSVRGKCPGDFVCVAGSTSSDICVDPCGAVVTCDKPDPVV